MSVARFIADQRAFCRVPVAVCCAILGLSTSWFYKWIKEPVSPRRRRRAELDAEIASRFASSGGTYRSPRMHTDVVEAGRRVSVNTVAESMMRQGLFGRKRKRPKGLMRRDRKAPKFPDLVRRDFTATAPDTKWVGDVTEIPTDDGKLYMAKVIDLFSRKLLACPIGEHPDAPLCMDAIKIAVAVRGGKQAIRGVIFHSDRGSTFTATDFMKLCREQGVRQSMGRVGSCFDKAAAESFFSTLEHEVLSRHHFTTKAEAREVIGVWYYEFYNTRRRHSTAGMQPLDRYEARYADGQPAAA